MKRPRWTKLHSDAARALAEYGVTHPRIAEILGRSDEAVTQRLAYLRRSEEMRERVRERTRAKRARLRHEARA